MQNLVSYRNKDRIRKANAPVLSFLKAPARPPGIPTDKIVPLPSAKTASIPSTVPCKLPYLINRSPPAFVEMFPAMWQDPFAPRSRGIMYPLGWRKLERTSRIAPPSAVKIPSERARFYQLGSSRPQQRIKRRANSPDTSSNSRT